MALTKPVDVLTFLDHTLKCSLKVASHYVLFSPQLQSLLKMQVSFFHCWLLKIVDNLNFLSQPGRPAREMKS